MKHPSLQVLPLFALSAALLVHSGCGAADADSSAGGSYAQTKGGSSNQATGGQAGEASGGQAGQGEGGTGLPAGGAGGAGGTSGVSGASGIPSDSTPQLDALVTQKLAVAHMPGVSACVVKHGKVAWCHAWGLANLEANRPVTLDTVFLLASISKTITATALMQLWESNAFGLDDDVDPAVPYSVKHPSSGVPITYRGLLTHMASVRDNAAMLEQFYAYDKDPSLSLGQAVSGYFDPAGPYYSAQGNFVPSAPGTAFEYSNLGFALIGHLAETLSGTDFAALTKQKIFEPLKMSWASWRLSDFSTDALAMPYGFSNGAYQPYGQYTFADYPDGGLRTTAYELARFLAAISSGGLLDGNRILQASTIAEMTKVQNPSIDAGQGLGFHYVQIGVELWVGHNGGESGVATDMYYRPSDGLGFVSLMNGDWGDDPTPVYDIEDAFIGLGEQLP